MRIHRLPLPAFAIGALATLAGVVAPMGSASAYTEKVLYNFCSQTNCADGAVPSSRLVMDGAGNLYGVTIGGTDGGGGVVYELAKTSSTYTYHGLHAFCPEGCGDIIFSRLIVDVNGNLYGTTQYSGAYGQGSIYKLHPNKNRTRWTLTTLYSFCALGGPCVDGQNPWAGLTYQGEESGSLYNGTSPLYGSTVSGGSDYGNGVVFELKGRAHTKYSVIHDFCVNACTDGSGPASELILDANGNLYGRGYDVDSGDGLIFELSPAGKQFAETVLFNFCAGCLVGSDGPIPINSLTLATDGSLIGSTQYGGQCNEGLVFSLVPTGIDSNETVLWNYCREGGEEGEYPQYDKPILDAQGNIFGTTSGGGGESQGTVYEVTAALAYDQLYSFCSQTNCADGASPTGLISDSAGNFFGVTSAGGAKGQGVVWELSP